MACTLHRRMIGVSGRWATIPIVSAGTVPHKLELRVCTHKTCKRQGSRQILQFVKDLALGQVEAKETGCLGNCGNGPNMVLLPSGQQLAHISTSARVAQVLTSLCNLQVDAAVLKATELRLAGNNAARAGELQKAIQLYTKGLELNPSFGTHLLLSNRSGARLAAGDAEGALEDAVAAVRCAPPDFTTAHVRQVEALLRLGRHTSAMQVLLVAVEHCPEFAKAPEYHMMVEHVQSALGAAAVKAK